MERLWCAALTGVMLGLGLGLVGSPSARSLALSGAFFGGLVFVWTLVLQIPTRLAAGGQRGGRKRLALGLSWATLSLPPLAWVLAGPGPEAREVLGAAGSVSLAVALVAPALSVGTAHRLKLLRTPGALPFSLTIATLVGLAFVWVHDAQQTFIEVKIGRQGEHASFMIGSIGLGCLSWLSLLVASQSSKAEFQPSRWMYVLLSTGIGGVLLATSSRVAPSLRPWLHLWWLGHGALNLFAAAWLAVPPQLTLVWRRIARGTQALAVLSLGLALWTFTTGLSSRERAHLASNPTGRTLLATLLRPLPPPAPPPGSTYQADWDRGPKLEHAYRQPNLILITIDTWRADALDPSTPAARMLLSEGSHFRDAFAIGTATHVSLSSLLNAHNPWSVPWEQVWLGRDGPVVRAEAGKQRRSRQRMWRPREQPGGSLASRMARSGRRTLASLDVSPTDVLREGLGFLRGFEQVEKLRFAARGQSRSAQLVGKALTQLDGLEEHETFFQWLHFLEPHGSRGDREHYAELCSRVEEALADYLQGLKERGHWEDTAIVLTSDHGEAFGLEGRRNHAGPPHAVVLRVPLLIRIPGAPARVVEGPVSTLDGVRTLLALADAPDAGAQGYDLSKSVFEGDPVPGRPIFARHFIPDMRARRLSLDAWAVIYQGRKMSLDRGLHQLSLYDLVKDPEEKNNLALLSPEAGQKQLGWLSILATQSPPIELEGDELPRP